MRLATDHDNSQSEDEQLVVRNGLLLPPRLHRLPFYASFVYRVSGPAQLKNTGTVPSISSEVQVEMIETR